MRAFSCMIASFSFYRTGEVVSQMGELLLSVPEVNREGRRRSINTGERFLIIVSTVISLAC